MTGAKSDTACPCRTAPPRVTRLRRRQPTLRRTATPCSVIHMSPRLEWHRRTASTALTRHAMPTTPPPRRIAVIGGGIAGLAAAYRLIELDSTASVTLFEGSSRLGGSLHTERRDGFLGEQGADSFITNVPWGVDLCRRLGLADELIGTNSQGRQAFVVRRGRLAPVPEGFMLMAPSRAWPIVRSPILSPLGKLRLAWEYFVPRRGRQRRRESGEFCPSPSGARSIRTARAAAGVWHLHCRSGEAEPCCYVAAVSRNGAAARRADSRHASPTGEQIDQRREKRPSERRALRPVRHAPRGIIEHRRGDRRSLAGGRQPGSIRPFNASRAAKVTGR